MSLPYFSLPLQSCQSGRHGFLINTCRFVFDAQPMTLTSESFRKRQGFFWIRILREFIESFLYHLRSLVIIIINDDPNIEPLVSSSLAHH
jgi:hypothetical protein